MQAALSELPGRCKGKKNTQHIVRAPAESFQSWARECPGGGNTGQQLEEQQVEEARGREKGHQLQLRSVEDEPKAQGNRSRRAEYWAESDWMEYGVRTWGLVPLCVG